MEPSWSANRDKVAAHNTELWHYVTTDPTRILLSQVFTADLPSWPTLLCLFIQHMTTIEAKDAIQHSETITHLKPFSRLHQTQKMYHCWAFTFTWPWHYEWASHLKAWPIVKERGPILHTALVHRMQSYQDRIWQEDKLLLGLEGLPEIRTWAEL